MMLQWLISGILVACASALSGNDVYDCVFHIVLNYLPGECLCFFVDAKNHSLMFENLIKELGDMRAVYIVSPDDDQVLVSMSKTEPIKPFPCYFIVDLPYVGSTMAWLLLRGSYQRGDYNMNESRYLVVAEEHHTINQAIKVLEDMFIYGFLDVDFVNPDASQVDIFALFPFGRDLSSCPERTTAVMDKVAVWVNGSLDVKQTLFPKKLPSGAFSGCSWNISCAFYLPYTIVNRGGRFSGPLRGYDAGPLSVLLGRLNLTPEWFIDIDHFWLTNHVNGSASGAIPDLVLGRGAQMSCGGLFLSPWAMGNTDPTTFHTWGTISWFVAAPDKVPKWIMLFVALENPVWATVIATSTIVPVIYWLFCAMTRNKESFSVVFLKLTALGFGNSTGAAPVSLTLRFLFFSWLFYVLHIDQFYLASLTQLITTAEYEPSITNVDQLLESKLPTAAYLYTVKTLCDSDDPNILKLMENSITLTKVVVEELKRMSQYKNFSIAGNQLFLKYVVSLSENVSIYPTHVDYEERTISALMWRHNYLFERINWLLIRMFDAGYPNFFLKRTVPDKFWTKPNDNSARPFTLRDLSGSFLILIIGLSLACLAFVTEVVYCNRSRLFGSRNETFRKMSVPDTVIELSE